MNGEKPIPESLSILLLGIVGLRRAFLRLQPPLSFLDWNYSPQKVRGLSGVAAFGVCASGESGCLRSQPKVGDKSHLRLNITVRPIANKYREGKLQRTLKREFKRA